MADTTCPFLATEDGILTPYGYMCSIHSDESGKPRFPCLKINCKVLENIHNLEDQVAELKRQL